MDQQGRSKTGRTERINGELLGEFMERNIVERTVKTEIDGKKRIKGEG